MTSVQHCRLNGVSPRSPSRVVSVAFLSPGDNFVTATAAAYMSQTFATELLPHAVAETSSPRAIVPSHSQTVSWRVRAVSSLIRATTSMSTRSGFKCSRSD